MSLWLTLGDENQGQIEWTRRVFLALPQRIGCPILRAFCEGWDKQKLRGRSRVKSSGIPPFANGAKDGAPHPFWQGKKYGCQSCRTTEMKAGPADLNAQLQAQPQPVFQMPLIFFLRPM